MQMRGRSRLNRIVVEDDDMGIRTLHFGDTIQSALRPGPIGDEGLEYIDLFHIPVILRPSLRRVLFIGLGGASGPRQFLRDYPDAEIDVVEIDPEVIRIARELFGFEPGARCRVIEEDGAVYLRRSRRRFDLIVVDAYTTEKGDLVIPYEMTTPEFFELCARRLSDEGILLYNCAAAASDPITIDLHRTMSGVFPNRLTFELRSGDNTVMLAAMRPLEQRPSRIITRGKEMLAGNRLARTGVLRHCRSIRRELSGNDHSIGKERR